MTEPTLSAIDHIAITVHDLDQSERWYTEVLNFSRVTLAPGESFQRIIMRHPSGIILGLTRHDAPEASASYSERRPGLDHLSFGVADREQLEAWAVRFDQRGVAHSEITQIASSGSCFIAFRDPNNIQLEVFARNR